VILNGKNYAENRALDDSTCPGHKLARSVAYKNSERCK